MSSTTIALTVVLLAVFSTVAEAVNLRPTRRNTRGDHTRSTRNGGKYSLLSRFLESLSDGPRQISHGLVWASSSSTTTESTVDGVDDLLS